MRNSITSLTILVKLYLSHTVLNGKYTLRMVTAQTNVTIDHVEKAWDLIKETARNINFNSLN